MKISLAKKKCRKCELSFPESFFFTRDNYCKQCRSLWNEKHKSINKLRAALAFWRRANVFKEDMQLPGLNQFSTWDKNFPLPIITYYHLTQIDKRLIPFYSTIFNFKYRVFSSVPFSHTLAAIEHNDPEPNIEYFNSIISSQRETFLATFEQNGFSSSPSSINKMLAEKKNRKLWHILTSEKRCKKCEVKKPTYLNPMNPDLDCVVPSEVILGLIYYLLRSIKPKDSPFNFALNQFNIYSAHFEPSYQSLDGWYATCKACREQNINLPPQLNHQKKRKSYKQEYLKLTQPS